MGCGCKGKAGKNFKVKLPGGMSVSKSSEAEAVKFAAKHPGATVVKPATN